jgi:hypothetical protein
MGPRSQDSYGRLMAILHIEHPITDLDTWRDAFDNFAEIRRQAGVISERVARPVGDRRYIVVSLDFDTIEHAESFLRFLQNQVWTSTTSAPALAGTPRTAILEPVDGTDL